MATNRIYEAGKFLALAATYPATPSSGDPVLVGLLPGVAVTDEDSTTLKTSIDFGPSVYDLSVVASHGAIAAGDTVFASQASPIVLSNDPEGGVPFGTALEAIASGTATINVKVGAPAGSAGASQAPLLFTDIQVTNAEMLAIRATPKTLVAAPGASKAVIVHRAHFVHSGAAGAYTETADNLVVEYAGGGDIMVIEATGFLDQASVIAQTQAPAAVVTEEANVAVQLKNNGDGEFGGGNAATTFSIRLWYSVVDTVAFS